MQVINPKARLDIRIGGETRQILASGDDNHADLYFSVEKDLSEEPNSAEFTLSNLNDDEKGYLFEAGKAESVIEFYATTIEVPDAVPRRVFAGEIERVENEDMHPGTVTRIYCSSQKINHREFWFQKTYAAGSYADDIINDLLSEIGLPKGNEWDQSTETIILSKSFAGPAYELLQRFMFDRGLYCYILDGKIYSSFVSLAPITPVKTVDDYVLRSKPEDTVRTARNLIEMKTVIEVTGRMPDDLKARSTRKIRKKKKKEIYGQNDYVEFEVVDQQINGKVFKMFLQPDFNPDDMFRYNLDLYRALSVEHEGDTFGGSWDTTLITDIYEDTGGDFI